MAENMQEVCGYGMLVCLGHLSSAWLDHIFRGIGCLVNELCKYVWWYLIQLVFDSAV